VKTPLRKRELADRESLRWVETAEAAQDVLAEAAMVTVVSDPGGRHLRQLGAASRGPLARAEPGDERPRPGQDGAAAPGRCARDRCPEGVEPLHWPLLTTHEVAGLRRYMAG
jgi:hypothetical protein